MHTKFTEILTSTKVTLNACTNLLLEALTISIYAQSQRIFCACMYHVCQSSQFYPNELYISINTLSFEQKNVYFSEIRLECLLLQLSSCLVSLLASQKSPHDVLDHTDQSMCDPLPKEIGHLMKSNSYENISTSAVFIYDVRTRTPQ